MSSLQPFIDAAPRQPPADSLSVGGEAVEVRPLTLAEVLRLWDAFSVDETGDGSILLRWAVFFEAATLAATEGRELTADEAESGWMSAVYARGLLTLYPEKGKGWVVDRCDGATAEELVALHDWFVHRHSWIRILSEIFAIDFDGENPKPRGPRKISGLEFLMRIEKNGGRRIEEMLSMTPEAYLDYINQLGEINKADARDLEIARRGGRQVSAETLGDGLAAGFPTTQGEPGVEPMPSTFDKWPEPKWPEN